MPKQKITTKTAFAIFVSPGVLVDGGGFIIVNGKIVKVPPRGPLHEKLLSLANELATAKSRISA